jgi:hypothetical protein
LDPDRACSAAQDGTLSLAKAAIRLTQMMKAGDTFLYVRRVYFHFDNIPLMAQIIIPDSGFHESPRNTESFDQSN